MKTLVIDNFNGNLTSYTEGDLNSGRSLLSVCSGQNPFVDPGNLTWNEAPTLIDPNGSVITDLIVAGKERVESGILYVYAIGHLGRLYKIQVNDPSSYNPDYDNPVLVATLTAGSPTFTRGGYMDFFGATEKILIGHDKGVTSINFDGTGEVAMSGTFTQNVPRPLKQFLGKEYVGNGANIAEIDTTNTVTTSTKLSPGFPTNTQVRDIDLSVDGNYLELVVSRLALGDITSATQDTSSTANAESYIFGWNGADTSYTTSTTFPSFSLSANILFGGKQFTFGSDQFGNAVYDPVQKIISSPESPTILPNSVNSTGSLMSFLSPIYFDGVLEADMYTWGQFDFEVGNPLGFWDLFFLNATAPETDINQTPFQMSVSNTGIGSSSNGYPKNQFGTSKIYFSSLETSSAPTTKYRFYKWRSITSQAVAPSTNCLITALYQTQTQLFSKKVTLSEIRIYAKPWVANNSFSIDIIGSSGNPISGASKTFTAAVNTTGQALQGELIIGNDFAWYTPQSAPTYAIGVLITNLGTANHSISKIEIDINEVGGK